jgi:drug/metabolite transporter (DMT)-like permease
MDASAKWLGQHANPMQIVAVRYIGSAFFVILLLNPLHIPRLLRTNRPCLQCVRSACLVLSTTCAYVAVHYLALTDMTTLTFASPLIVPLLAGPFLGEKIGPRRVIAIGVGFAGVLLVTRPGGHGLHPAALLVLVGALMNAFYSIATRKLAECDTPETTLFYTGMVGSVVLLPVLPFVWTTPTQPAVWALMAGISVLGALAHWLLILAHKYAQASLLAPFYYMQLFGAVVIARIVFNETPDKWTLSGGAVIIASGLYVLYREQVRKRERAVKMQGNAVVPGDAVAPDNNRDADVEKIR